MPPRPHGALKYRKEGCTCEVCRAGQAERIRGQRARRKARAAEPTSDAQIISLRRSPAAPDGSSGRTGRVRASRKPVAPAVAPIVATDPVDQVPAPASASASADPDVWTPGLWENELLPILDMPAQRDDGWIGTVTLDPGYDYHEYLHLLESCREHFDDFPLEWEYAPGIGVHIWRTDHVPTPEPAESQPVSRVETPVTVASTRKVGYEFTRNTHGMCQVKLSTDETHCRMAVEIEPSRWKYIVSGQPVCQDHYNAVRADFPERCKYMNNAGQMSAAPKQPRSVMNPQAPSVAVTPVRNASARVLPGADDSQSPVWG